MTGQEVQDAIQHVEAWLLNNQVTELPYEQAES